MSCCHVEVTASGMQAGIPVPGTGGAVDLMATSLRGPLAAWCRVRLGSPRSAP